MHLSRYRLGELPLYVISTEDGRAYVDVLSLGRVELFSGDYVQYDDAWRVTGVVRRGTMEAMGD